MINNSHVENKKYVLHKILISFVSGGSSLETVQSTCTGNKTPACLAIPETSQSPELPSPSCSTQTPAAAAALFSNSPRKMRYGRKIKDIVHENK